LIFIINWGKDATIYSHRYVMTHKLHDNPGKGINKQESAC